MSGKVFEYFFDSDELEPQYSELLSTMVHSGRTVARARSPEKPTAPPTNNETPRVASVSKDSSAVPVPQSVEREPAAETIDRQPAAEATEPTDGPKTRAEPIEVSATPQTRLRQLISVHALGQALYCIRSAILSIEQGDQQEINEELPRLTYLPTFELSEIEQLLSKKMGQFAFAAIYGLSMVCLMVASVLVQNRALFFPALFVFLGVMLWGISLLSTIARLALRRRMAINAEATKPDFAVEQIQPANWWSLLASGYEIVRLERPLRHSELSLEGCPWRVLEHGDQKIPVIRSGSKSLGSRKGELYSKHQIRLAAYALLLEADGYTDVPFGLVFPCDSPQGFALPITNDLRKRTIETLHSLENKLEQSQQHQVEPRLPEQRSRCGSCRYGYPTRIEPAEIKAKTRAGSQLVVLEAPTGKTFRCDCADRFGSVPPHHKSVRDELRVRI